ncbi:MAG TPA: hypothetical protein VEC60_09115 [Reyranella sp.]|nr:hypothetical protein [Reyranella sp.]
MVSNTVRRVPDHTDDAVNDRILEDTARRVLYYSHHRDGIDRRLRQLDREWDIERVLETNASALAFLGIVLGSVGDRRWLRLSAVVTAFLFQHAVQGWCPPIPMLRRLGIRTAREIEVERVALKALRGDFDTVGDASGALEAAAR